MNYHANAVPKLLSYLTKTSKNTIKLKLYTSIKSLSFIVFFFVFFSHQSFALGRLFTTPDQRIKLEKKQLKNTPDQVSNQPSHNNFIHLNGFVKPKNGASTIWVNGVKRNKIQQENIYIQRWVSPQHQISVDLKDHRVQLRPGQRLNIKNKVVQESYRYPRKNNSAENKITNMPSKSEKRLDVKENTLQQDTEAMKLKVLKSLILDQN